MMRKRGRLALMLLPLWVSACTWVPLTDEGSHVQVRTSDQVQGCERKSRVTTAVKDKIGDNFAQRGKGARGASDAGA